MSRRSRAGGKSPNAQAPNAAARKSRIAPKAMGPRNPSAARKSMVARLTRERDEALEQQAATSEVLQVISSSPGDLQPVLTTILKSAARICVAKCGNVYLWDGDAFRLVAAHNTPPAFSESRKRAPFRPNPGHPFRSLVETKQVFHVATRPHFLLTRNGIRKSSNPLNSEAFEHS